MGAGTDEGEPPTFGAPSATPELHSRAGVSTSTEGVGGRTAVSLGGLCAVLEHNCLVRIAKLVGVGTERLVP